MNKKLKGFTLIELLVTIAILTVVFVVVGYFIINIIGNNNEKAKEISINSIESAAKYYSMEFKGNNEWYDDYIGSGETLEQNGTYACTTIQRLIDKGFIVSDAVLPEGYDKNSLIVIRRDNLKTITSSSINPEETVTCSEYDSKDADFTITKNEPDGLNSWYKKENLKGKISVEVGRSGIKEINYYYKYDGNIVNIENEIISDDNMTSEVDFDIGINSNDIKVCAKVVNGLDKIYEKCFESQKIDHEVPTTPIITFSDNKSIDSWHSDSILTLNLKQQDEKIFVSGDLVYYFDNKDATIETSSISLSNEETGIKTYYGKACTQAGNCSEVAEYILKYDKTKPTGTLTATSEKGTTFVTTNFSGIKDDDSGISKYYYLIQSSSTCPDSGYTSSTSESKSFTNLTNGVYYVCGYIEDNAGNKSDISKTSVVVQNYVCTVGTLTDDSALGMICVVSARTNNWSNTVSSSCLLEGTTYGKSCYHCPCEYTCEENCYDDYADTGYSETFGIDDCLNACWIGGCVRCGSCYYDYTYTGTCTSTNYYCASGWNVYSGSGYNLKCYKKAS